MARIKAQTNNLPEIHAVDNLSTLIEWLKFIYLNVNDQQKYAESKNGAILILNSALVIGYLTFLPYNINDCPFYLLLYSISFVILNTFAIVFSLLSFLPTLNNKIKEPKPQKNKNLEANIFFFMHLADYTERELLSRIYDDLKISNKGDIDSICTQISNQIIKNSSITKKKHQLFTTAVWLTLFGITTPIIGGIILLGYSILKGRKN
ncbi:MAG: DUF5706 domain-containing protein [Chloroflexi bacterium]|nr:DUF5706 domain-containing protein [Chloroflexota bacterium]